MDPKSLAYQIHDILERYIPIHDDVFKMSFRRFVPIPGFFEAVDFTHHSQRLNGQQAELEQILVVIAELKHAAPAASSVSEFLTALDDYASALAEAIRRLRDICVRLHQKSEGAEYNTAAYKADTNFYNTCAERYQELGIQLNSLFARL